MTARHFFRAWAALTATGVVAGLAVSPVAAQSLPDGTEPEHIEDRIRLPPVVTPPAEPIDIPEITPQAAPEGAESVTFVLTGVDLEGNSALDTSVLSPIFEDYLGQEISLATLYQIAAAITAAYRDAGYILSQALVPAQRIQAGRVSLKVIEGFIDQVTVEGDDASGRIAAMGAEIAAARPLTNAVLERYLLLLQEMAGLSVRAVLTASHDTPGAADLTLVSTRDELSGYVAVDNRGTNTIGPYQITTTLTVNNVFGWDGRATVTAFTAPFGDELRYVMARMEQPVWHEGAIVSAAVAYSRTNPGAGLADFDNEGEATSLDFGLSHPVIRSRDLSVTARLEFNWRDSTADLFASSAPFQLYDDRLRSLRGSLDLNFADAWAGQGDVSLTLSRGLDIAGASRPGDRDLSRGNGDPQFTSLQGRFGRLQPIGTAFALSFRASFQYALDPLLASEETGFGGSSFGSAFRSSSITGDSGLGARLELIWYWALTAEETGGLAIQGQSYGFADGALIWERDPGAGERSRDGLSSAGIGARVQLPEGGFGGWELAFPLDAPAEADKPGSARLFFQLGASF